MNRQTNILAGDKGDTISAKDEFGMDLFIEGVPRLSGKAIHRDGWTSENMTQSQIDEAVHKLLSKNLTVIKERVVMKLLNPVKINLN